MELPIGSGEGEEEASEGEEVEEEEDALREEDVMLVVG